MKEKTILKSLHLCLDIDTSIFDSIFDIQGYGHHLYTYIGKLNEKVEEADLNKFFMLIMIMKSKSYNSKIVF